MYYISNKKRGMGMIEVVVGATIISIGIVGLITAYNYYLRIMVRNTPNIQAAYLLEESIEVMRLLRDQSWRSNISAMTLGMPYFLVYNATTSKWTTSSTADVLIDGQFRRTVTASSTFRNASRDIVPEGTAGATLDASSTLMIAKVEWSEGSGTTTKTLSAYLVNLFSN